MNNSQEQKPAALKMAIVTGGSRGIGAATALILGQQGYGVVVNYANAVGAAQAVVAQIVGAGGAAIAVQADVADEAQVLALFATADAWGAQIGAKLHVLVNNAGVVDYPARVDQMTVARLKRMFDTNVIGTMVCAREAVLRMSTRYGGAGGAMVNLSSAAARLGSPNQYVDYAASKGAIDSLTIGLAKEVAAEGIRVNGVRPGIIDTDIHASGGLPDRVAQMASAVPMLRGGSAQEVAQAICWLLSDAASYVTGTTLDVTGGR